jgi:hypothetical protein
MDIGGGDDDLLAQRLGRVRELNDVIFSVILMVLQLIGAAGDLLEWRVHSSE